MKNTLQLAALIALTLAISTAALATQGVSPGATDRMAQVNDPCPTFSWVANQGAERYELVAYTLPEDPAEPVELTTDTEVLYASIPAGATSWTPSAQQCVAPGGRYVWFVRAVTERVGDQVIEAGEWSEGRYFSVPVGPSEEELTRAVEILERWLAANGGIQTLVAAADAATVSTNATAADTGAATVPAKGTGSTAPKSVPTASAAIRGEHPDTTGVVYGVVGTSGSPAGAGVAAANLDGGPDLVLDGSVDGQADAVLTQEWLDRPSTDDEVFSFRNSGGGAMDVAVEGGMWADTMHADEVVVDGTTLLDASGDWLGNGSTVPCAGCVSSSDIADGAVTGTKISAGAVGSGALRDGAVTSAKIADGTITAADIDPAAALDADTLDGQDSASFQKAVAIGWADSGFDTVYVDDCTTVIEVSVDATGPGTIVLDGVATAVFQHTLGTVDGLTISFEANPAYCPSSAPDQQWAVVPAELPTRIAWPAYVTPITVSKLYEVSAAGPYTYFLNAKMGFGGASQTDNLIRVNVRAMFVPD